MELLERHNNEFQLRHTAKLFFFFFPSLLRVPKFVIDFTHKTFNFLCWSLLPRNWIILYFILLCMKSRWKFSIFIASHYFRVDRNFWLNKLFIFAVVSFTSSLCLQTWVGLFHVLCHWCVIYGKLLIINVCGIHCFITWVMLTFNHTSSSFNSINHLWCDLWTHPKQAE